MSDEEEEASRFPHTHSEYCQWHDVNGHTVGVPGSLTTTSYAVLGLLSVRPWTAYELAQQVERSLGWFWPRTVRKIYDEPKRLVADGLASAAVEMTGRRRSSVYDITPEGRAALADWLDGPSADPKFESEAMVRVFFADAGTLEQLRRTLAEAAEAAERRVSVLSAMSDSLADDDYPYADRRHLNEIAMRFGLANHRAIAEWARWALAETDGWPSIEGPD